MITDKCKHCGLKIVSDTGAQHTWRHLEGQQFGKATCALDPYGFTAGPEGEACPHVCRAVWDSGFKGHGNV